MKENENSNKPNEKKLKTSRDLKVITPVFAVDPIDPWNAVSSGETELGFFESQSKTSTPRHIELDIEELKEENSILKKRNWELNEVILEFTHKFAELSENYDILSENHLKELKKIRKAIEDLQKQLRMSKYSYENLTPEDIQRQLEYEEEF